MFKRELTESLKGMAQKYPVVTLIGPRQSGKTTLACQTFPEYRYVNLEQTSMRLMAKEDPRGFLASNPPPLIIDEVQRCPELLSEIQVVSDSLNRNGAFILTGRWGQWRTRQRDRRKGSRQPHRAGGTRSGPLPE